MAGLEDRTRYEPTEVEPRIAERWLESGLFHPDPDGTPDENFSIAVPPPNVTGALHMGHALNGSIQDVLIRWNRMQGRRAKWILGTDHAGIATQKQVENRLAESGVARTELGREKFIGEVWNWTREHGGQILRQFQRIGRRECRRREIALACEEQRHPHLREQRADLVTRDAVHAETDRRAGGSQVHHSCDAGAQSRVARWAVRDPGRRLA